MSALKSDHRPLRTLFDGGSLLLLACWVVGQLLRDRYWLSGLCFYIPTPFMATTLLVNALWQWRTQRRRQAAIRLVLLLAPLSMWACVENRFWHAPPDNGTAQLRLVHWNICRTLRPQAKEILLSQQADIYVLSEIESILELTGLAGDLGSEYRTQMRGNLAVVAPGEIHLSPRLNVDPRIQSWLATCRLPARTGRILVVDLPSAVQIARDPLLAEVIQLIEEHQPDLIVGDFNAPRRSRRLSQLPAGYQHAYETIGSGSGYTWPVPLPMYSLDHCLFSPQIIPVRYQLLSSWSSDHRLQVFDFR